MMMASTEPRTLEAAFMAQAHSTIFPLVWPAGYNRQFTASGACQGPQASGERHAHGEAQGDQKPGTDRQFDHEGPAHQPSQQAGQHAYIQQQGGGNEQQGQPYPAGLRQPPARNHAARAARKQKQEHYYRQGIDRMAQEQDEALDEGDLDQDVSQPDRDEVEQAQRTRLLAPRPDRQRKHQKHQHGQKRDGQHHPQHGHAQIILPVNASLQRLGMEYLVELQSEKEKRGIVGYGRHIVRIALRKLYGDHSPGSVG